MNTQKFLSNCNTHAHTHSNQNLHNSLKELRPKQQKFIWRPPSKRLISLIWFCLILILFSNEVVFSQPVKKSTFNFTSELNHGLSEDWPFSIFKSADCIHIYFAGFTQFKVPNECPTGPDEVTRSIPIVGKYNSITQKLVWEREYDVVPGFGQFTDVFESGDFVWATGSQWMDPCMENTNSQIILKAYATNGNPVQFYPHFENPQPGPNYTVSNTRISPIME